MGQYFIKVSSEFQLLDMFLCKCTPDEDAVIVEIDSQPNRVPDVVVTCDKYPWIKRCYTHLYGYRPGLPGYETVDLSLLGSNDSSNIWVSKVFARPEPCPSTNLHSHPVYDMRPLEIPFSPRDPLIDSLL